MPSPCLRPRPRLLVLQYFPHCLLSSVSTIRGVPINSILLLPLRHFWCSQGFPPTNQRRHQCNRSLTRVPPSPRIPQFLLSFLLSSPEEFLCESRRIPLQFFALYNVDAFSKSPSLDGNASSHSFNSSFLHGLSCILCISSLHCQCSDHSFLFASQRSSNLASSSSFSKICTPLLHIAGFVILWRSPTLPAALLIIFAFLYQIFHDSHRLLLLHLLLFC